MKYHKLEPFDVINKQKLLLLSVFLYRNDTFRVSLEKNSKNIYFFVLETLPKPYIPSAVPFFTGREAEVKEITNLITDQSTRLLNIWGSPGFGKTSTAIGAAHHLVSLEYPVYFFKLHGTSTIEDFFIKNFRYF